MRRQQIIIHGLKNNMDSYQPVIGMEIHVELKTKSKMFCGCQNDPFYAPKPNIYTCPVCLGLPGALPIANKKAIEWTIKLGLALNCRINTLSKFDRKHYFYPDLPKGYQISQYDLPFCFDGYLETSYGKVRIRRIHLEEDTGKLIHKRLPTGEDVSLIDFNRSGVPLIEIVTEPDIKSASQAKEYAKNLYQVIRYLDISDCDMEKGGMRLEANISIKSQNDDELPNYKVELKNINSFRFLEKAIDYEIERQKRILKEGKTPVQETRGYNAEKNITYSQRKKEEAADYRYFPDPDIPPIRISESWLSEIKKTLPEGLEEVFSRWQKDYQLKKEIVQLLFETYKEKEFLDELFSFAKNQEVKVEKLVNYLVHKKSRDLFETDKKMIIDDYKKASTVSFLDEEKLKEIIKKVLKENQKAVLDYKKGKTSAINFLFGQVVKEAKTRLDFNQVSLMIKKLIT